MIVNEQVKNLVLGRSLLTKRTSSNDNPLFPVLTDIYSNLNAVDDGAIALPDQHPSILWSIPGLEKAAFRFACRCHEVTGVGV